MVYGVRGGFAYGDPSLMWKEEKENGQTKNGICFLNALFQVFDFLSCSKFFCLLSNDGAHHTNT
jgi:hypothetical protein